MRDGGCGGLALLALYALVWLAARGAGWRR